jgi:hypothetical protein
VRGVAAGEQFAVELAHPLGLPVGYGDDPAAARRSFRRAVTTHGSSA